MTASPHRIVVVSLFLLLIIEPLFSSASEAVCDAASGTCSSTTDVTSPYGEPQLTDNTAVIRQHLEDVDRYMRQIVFLEDKYLTVRDRCMNRHELCTFWATAGECTNSDFMTNECAPACFACDQLITDTPFDTAEEDLSLMYGEPQEIDGIEAASTIRRLHQVDAYMRETVFKEEKYAKVRNNCINRHSQCTFWASIGECEANFAYMQTNCSPACMSCDKLIFEDRCPIDTSAPEIWGPGDLNKLFSRIVTEPYYQQYKPVIIGQPGMENPHTGDIPWIVVLEEFLTEEECETLIELGAKQGYERSEDVGEETFDGTYGSVQSRERTSSNAWCQEECYDHPITKRIVQRMENLTGIPDENSEHFQLLRYNVGEFYGVHHVSPARLPTGVVPR